MWRATLAEIRRERLRRRLSLGAMVPLGVVLVTLAIFRWQAPQDGHPLELPPAVVVPARPEPAWLAVLVVRDGTPTLQALSPEAYGVMELRFTLDPITVDASQFVEMEMTSTWPVVQPGWHP